ncbi:unnamed protein product [Zymoseptoria tritici ST99CH_1A5]|uniref:CTLH domain-containing protein n=4 Tax=Zymoseptoria tritici TaxID=1047171 RepID=A0A1X7S2C0_ZYMT9|nr:unnamed protein product [Zymoseptoria tritici ST99CH_3D7]SMR58232.1 unnamed protein product [Zymoseptoria tritici ST99CH_1E4]SMR61208.1 unnamed protein product [Zymoseptoria tritici ST99CH_3D1]SMY27430.1 unnamed protein product [Zymoseptoria tritici ST99CH_1A5]
MTSSTSATASMRSALLFEQKVEEMKPSKSDINWVIMDYLVSEGYPGAAAKFAQETNISQPFDTDGIRDRVQIRSAIHAGKIDEAIDLINELDPQILDTDHILHFDLLQLQLIEIIRSILNKPDGGNPQSSEFRPALEFATEQLSPRAPTDQKYQQALERTMALMIFPPDKMTAEFKVLLDLKLRETVADSVNEAILNSKGQRPEAKIRQLVRARAWAEMQAREAKVQLPETLPIGLDGPVDGDPMVT